MVQTISPAAALRITVIKTLSHIHFGTLTINKIFSSFFTEEWHSSKVGEYGGMSAVGSVYEIFY